MIHRDEKHQLPLANLQQSAFMCHGEGLEMEIKHALAITKHK